MFSINYLVIHKDRKKAAEEYKLILRMFHPRLLDIYQLIHMLVEISVAKTWMKNAEW